MLNDLLCINIYIRIIRAIFLNMKASYTKIFNLCNLRLFLFVVLFIISGCQINQSVSILKEKLFSDGDELENEEKKISKSSEFVNKEITESSKKEESQKKQRKN